VLEKKKKEWKDKKEHMEKVKQNNPWDFTNQSKKGGGKKSKR
jgi:hypothetical protein